MKKEVRVEMSVSYDVIRQMFCMVSGKVLTDEKIEDMFKSEVVLIDTTNLGEARKDTEQMLASLVLANALEGIGENPKSKFEERLEEMKKQRGL